MKRIYIIISILVLIAVLSWAFIESVKPLPGIDAFQDGRNHKPIGTVMSYNSNPPTSGDHYPAWITKGFYDTPRLDPFLVHSMEHGYVIFWYDCAYKQNDDKKISIGQEPTASPSAQPFFGSLSMTNGNEGSESASLNSLPVEFRNGSCNLLKDQIKQIISSSPHKLIAVPRVGMDHPLILTAWGKKLILDKVDKDQIKSFINAYLDRGPELTNEP